MKTRRASAFIILALFVAMAFLCVSRRDLLVTPKPIVLCTTILWPGALYLARDLGYLPQDAVTIAEFTSTYDAIRTLRSGAADAAMLTLDEALVLNSYRPDYRVVLIEDFSDGGDVIVARPEFKSIRDLRGCRIAFDGGTLGTYMLERALSLAGLKGSDIIPVQIPLNQHAEAWKQGRIDASVTYGSHYAELVAAGGGAIFSTRDMPNEILGVLVVHKSATESNRRHLVTLVSSWFRVQDYVRKHPDDAYPRMARHQRIPPQVLREIMSGFSIPDRDVCIEFLASDKIRTIAKRLNDIMVNAKLISSPVPLDTIFDASIAKEATP